MNFSNMKALILCGSLGIFCVPSAMAHDHGHSHSHSHQAATSIQVHQPFVRLMPPMQPNTAAFMRLENTTSADRQLVSVSSHVSDVVELHTHNMVDGVMQMRQVAHIDVPAGGTATLQPGGLHIMLIGLKAPLQEGQTVHMTLYFDDGTEQQVQAPVQHPNAEMNGSHGHHQHGH